MPITEQSHPELIGQLPPNGMSYFGASMWKALADNPNGGEVEREGILETARQKWFPHLPSRFSVFFGAASLENAQRFKSKWGAPDSPIWVVECENSFRGDLNWFSHDDKYRSAIWYWQQRESPKAFWEYLLLPPISVLRRVE